MLATLSLEEIKEMFDRIEARLAEIGLTMEEFQLKLGILSQHWSNWKRRGIPSRRHMAIAKILGCSVEWLTTGKEAQQQDSKKNIRRLHTDAVGKVPLIAMGKINLWRHQEIQPTEYRSCPVEQYSDQTYAVIVEGNQMVSPHIGHKSYLEGSVLFVDPTIPVQSGKRVIALMPGTDHEIFREYRYEGGIHHLIPFNPQYKPIETTEDITFLGVVIAHVMQE